jgi:hypothetical protein
VVVANKFLGPTEGQEVLEGDPFEVENLGELVSIMSILTT